MAVTLILTSMPSESMLYQVLCLLDQNEVSAVTLVYDGHYHVGIDLISEKGLPFYKLVVDSDKSYFSVLNEAVQLSKTSTVFFLDPCMTIGSVDFSLLFSELDNSNFFALGHSGGYVNFNKGLADWNTSKGQFWISFDASIVDRSKFLELGGFDSAYQLGEAGSVGLCLTALDHGFSYELTDSIDVERLSQDFWLQGMRSVDLDQLYIAQSFLLFWSVGPRFFSFSGCIHLFRIFACCLFFQTKSLRAFIRALKWSFL